MNTKILGLSFFYHNSAACLLVDGVPIAMAEEERFSRKKHDSDFPKMAIDFVLKKGSVSSEELDFVVFYEKPFIKFERVVKTALFTFPRAPFVFQESIKHLFLNTIWIRHLIASQLKIKSEKILFCQHHLSHGASAFFCSPWEEAAVLTIDGVGEWATATIGIGEKNQLKILKEIRFPHSLGLLYSTFTAFLGFEINEGEYKVMGMAPYGKPRYIAQIKKIIKIYDDGSFELNLDYFAFHKSLKKSYSNKFIKLFDKPRDSESKFFTRTTGWPSYFGPMPEKEKYKELAEEQEYYADIAASVQLVTEEIIIKLAKEAGKLTGLNKLCFAGGVALNSAANWQILKKTDFDEIFIQPSAGDGGAALGAALAVCHIGLNQKKKFILNHAYFGQEYSLKEIEEVIFKNNIKNDFINNEEKLIQLVTDYLIEGKVIGWFHGRFEWGPRALGARSILADPRRAEMKDIVNTKIKFREPYRPFAPSVLAEHIQDFFEIPNAKNHWPLRFMLYVASVKKDKRKIIPAVTHIDGTARPQAVFKKESPRYWKLINNFFHKTGVPLVLNTSFNLKGEPIVNTPQDAINTFRKSNMDILVLENFVLYRS